MKPTPTINLNRIAAIQADLKAGLLEQPFAAHLAIRDLLTALKHMTEWKDNAYRTIDEMRDAAYTPSWSGGKTQQETIGQIQRLQAHSAQMSDLNGPYCTAVTQLQTTKARLRATRKALRALRNAVMEIDCSYGRAQTEAIQTVVDQAMDEAVVVLHDRSRRRSRP